MKKNMKKVICASVITSLALSVAACGNTSERESGSSSVQDSVVSNTESIVQGAAADTIEDSGDGAADSGNNGMNGSTDSSTTVENVSTSSDANGAYSDILDELMRVSVQFEGGSDEVFVAHLYDNDTTVELARNIGSDGKRLPIYNYDGFEECEEIIYYDIPSYHDIPDSDTVTVTSVKAGEIYYSHPNRVILYLVDMEVEAEYVPVGYIESPENAQSAYLAGNVLDYWDCKVVPVNYMD